MIMKRTDINIRDPYVLVDNEKYYIYGTRSSTCWGLAEGFDVYVSDDLEEFEGPIEIFKRPDDFFANSSFWAPECYKIGDRYYLVTTLGSDSGWKKGIFLMVSDNPTGPFELYSEKLTPENWTCIDGTLWFEDDRAYLIYSHSFEDVLDPSCADASYDGEYVMQELSADMKQAVSAPAVILKARDFAWARPFPYAREEFGVEGDVYFSDGPCFMKMSDGRLYMISSTWSKAGYAVGVASSENGIHGPWTLQEHPLYPENGGHGMFFKDKNGDTIFTLHYPNDKYKEHPVFYRVELRDGQLILGQQI